MRALRERGQATLLMAAHSSIDGLAAHSTGGGRLTVGQAISDDGEDRVITPSHFC